MKKTYFAPETRAYKVKVNQMVMTSLVVSEEEVSGSSLLSKKKGIWDSLDDTEE